jgi:hypothetical protein
MEFFVSNRKKIIACCVILLLCIFGIRAQTTSFAVSGIVIDSLSGKAIESVAISFEKGKVGTLTNQKGEFRLSNNKQSRSILLFSAMGYKSKQLAISPGRSYILRIKLVSEGIRINEVVIKPSKEKYSKKDNPAVELIKKVIANKDKNIVETEDYYRYSQYERIFFALNDFNPNKGLLKSQKYLAKYTDTSGIDGRRILPYTVREYYKDVYHQKSPKETKKIVIGYNQQGVDKNMDNAGFSTFTDEVFKDINIRDNQINMFLLGFVGPLNNNSSVNFYKWYIRDTVNIDQKQYIQLGFLPFNTRDVGFSGEIFVRADSTYAIKKVLLRFPRKANINFVKTILINQEFEQLESGLWAPYKFTTMVDFEYKKLGKLYVQKDQTFSDYKTGTNYKQVFSTSDPEIKLQGFNKKDKQFWEENRPAKVAKDLRLDSMMMEANKNKYVRLSIKVADFISSGYYHTIWNPEKNKLDIGTAQTFYSTNNLEGNRFRLSALTTANFNRNLFLYGYGAYGTQDNKWKYSGEIAWAFKKREQIKDEFPRNNITLSYKYDVNTLGQRYLQATRDNFLQSFRIRDVDNMTYERSIELNYVKEWQKGFSVSMSARTEDQRAAGYLRFDYANENGVPTPLESLKTTEIGLTLRYAHNEKFVQLKRRRQTVPTESTIFTLENTWGLKDVLAGKYNYHVMGFSLDKAKWVPPFGQVFFSMKAEKIWGEVPFPLLLTPNANNSYTLLRGSFNLITPLEFINDRQLTWMVDYHMGGWLFNRIPLIKSLKLREVFGFHGLLGDLNNKNNPDFNSQALVFPGITHQMGNTPYMEYNIGIENIFNLIRVDYVRRLNYLNHPNIDKNGIRIGFTMSF